MLLNINLAMYYWRSQENEREIYVAECTSHPMEGNNLFSQQYIHFISVPFRADIEIIVCYLSKYITYKITKLQ